VVSGDIEEPLFAVTVVVIPSFDITEPLSAATGVVLWKITSTVRKPTVVPIKIPKTTYFG
jgi:hypothetical protein